MPEQDDIKAVMDEMPYGLYIIGSRMGNEVNAMMADWVMQVSFVPAWSPSPSRTMRRP